ncbi:MAG: DNA repair protein RecO [Bacteroidales bacterium]|nr:DNA repair protein RecO [Bacteroidales bacterium]
MLVSTSGMVLHTTPYGETSVVARIFTRQLGVRSYLVKGVRTQRGRVKQNLLQPLSCLDMVVYDSRHGSLDYIKEMAPRHPAGQPSAVGNALRFFMTEVLYKVLRDEEPLPSLWDYVEQQSLADAGRDTPMLFMLGLSHHLGIEPLDNFAPSAPLFDLQQGCFVGAPGETTLPQAHSALLHSYLPGNRPAGASPAQRRDLLGAMIAYFQMHLASFGNITSHEILHTVLR